MRKKLFMLLIIVFLSMNVKASIIGDVDNNGKVGIEDYNLIRAHQIKYKVLTGEMLKRADVMNDGKVGIEDYTGIRRILLKMPLRPNTSSAENTTSSSVNNQTVAPSNTPKPTTKPTARPTPTPTVVPASNKNLEIYFLNTFNNSSLKNSYGNNESIVIKTSSGKYILVDTGINKNTNGDKTDEVKKLIYNRLKEIQGTSKINIDYMILSHMHTDHIGNAIDILNDSKITIKNLILKQELKTKADEKIVKAAKANKVSVIDARTLKDGISYEIDSLNTLYIFNTKDVYSDSDDCTKTDYYLKFTAKKNSGVEYAKTKNGKYIYFEGSDYLTNGANVKIYTSANLDFGGNNTYIIKNRFYAVTDTSDKTNSCNSNVNSLALLLVVKTQKGNKYVYLPNDLQNSGYSPFGENDSSYNTIIHGHQTGYFWKYELVNGVPYFIVKNNKLVKNPNASVVKRASEYLVAVNIKKKFSDITTNLTIYQSAHHGINNVKEAVSKLKLNREGVYSIVLSSIDSAKASTFAISESAYYLRNTNLMTVGKKDIKGIKCTIKNSGTTSCADY